MSKQRHQVGLHSWFTRTMQLETEALNEHVSSGTRVLQRCIHASNSGMSASSSREVHMAREIAAGVRSTSRTETSPLTAMRVQQAPMSTTTIPATISSRLGTPERPAPRLEIEDRRFMHERN